MKAKIIGAWAVVAIPFAYGFVQSLRTAAALFTG